MPKAHRSILWALIGLTFLGNAVWISLDTKPPSWDESLHLRLAFKYWQVLTSGSERMWFDLLNVEPFYPPFYHFSLLPVMVLLGFSNDNAIWVNSFFLSLTLVTTYYLGKKLYDMRTGLIASFLIFCAPEVVYVARLNLIDTMLTAMVSLAYFLFLKSKYFEDRFYSFFFSCVFAVGLMVKWTFFIYLLPAIFLGLLGPDGGIPGKRLAQSLYYFGMICAAIIIPFWIFILGEWKWLALFLEFAVISALVRYTPAVHISPNKIINLLTLTFVSILICFPWYAHNLVNIVKGVFKFGINTPLVVKGSQDFNLPESLFYFQATSNLIGMVFFIILVPALIIFLIRKKCFNWLLFGWALFPLVLFSFLNNMDGRYIMPCISALMLILAYFISSVSNARGRNLAIGFVVVVGLSQYIFSGFIHGSIRLPILKGPALVHNLSFSQEKWHIDTILDDIVRESAPPSGEIVTVRTLTNHPAFHRGAFRNSSEIRGLPVIVKSVKRNQGELTDFFITKDSSQEGESGSRLINPKRDRLFDDPSLNKTFSLFKSYPLPNGARGLVFKRDVSSVTDIEGADDLGQVGKKFLAALPQYPIYGIKQLKNANVTITPTDNQEDLFLGRYKKITVTADSAVSNKIRLDDLELTFHDVQINLYELFLHGKLILFEIGRLFPRATIHFEPLEKLIIKEMKGKGDVRLEGDGERLHLRANYQLPPPLGTIEGNARVKLVFEPGKSIRPLVETVTVGPLAAREIFYRRILDEKISLTPTPGWPLFTDIRTVNIFPRRLEINQGSNGSS